ncbi:Podocan [Bagarius yarrelli]|uniref:Podocan n=1 Tax=Bagarius yarrelli TaxID=175774 RepID=A0A556VBL6_BAGYA|nr:Podocan [Bagarius yarrelli]
MIWRCVLCALLLCWTLVLGVEPEHQQEERHTGQKNKEAERDRKENTLMVCPDQCSCTAEDAVDCAGVNLYQLPQEIPESTRHLSLQLTAAPRFLPPTLVSADFAANQLTTIYFYTFGQKPGLKSVYLHNNKLADTGLPDGMFNGSDNLEVLILSSNYLRNVPKGLPTALFRLHLKNNKLEKIPSGALENLPHLRELYLQNNLLSNSGMDNTTFSHLSRLEYLDLSNNNLSAVPLGLPRTLMLLHLEKNYITSVAVDSLSAVKDLQYLLLHHNRLRARHIHRDAFRGLKRLHTLHLHHNLLERIPLGLPRRAHTLVLLRNFISEIGRDDLSTLYTLNELNLSYNRLTSERLHRHAFRKLRVLEVLDLSGNKLSMLPLGLPKSLHILRAKDNQIADLPEGALAAEHAVNPAFLLAGTGGHDKDAINKRF